ncbi:uncharacterized protein [Arachis hypogaea]|uniref:uncharacterized protein n=1 Tax=Arachis hypogaea TaxID=3818 RepID=UPI003B211C42
MEKDIFLDIACFFKGWPKDYVTEKLKRCGHDAEIGIDILINRSLVTLEPETFLESTLLGMHDLLEEMGKQIVIQESPNDACNRSRLWCLEDVEFVLTQNKKTKATHGIVLHKEYSENEVNQRDLSFSKMCQLKLLILDGVKAPILCDIPCTLKVFRWRDCPLKTLPLTDHQRYELVEINLSESQIVELWDGKKVLEKLEHLDLSWCKQLKQMPDLSGAPNLKTLNLSGCEELDYIHPSLAHHKRLVELDLSRCNRLETLGDKLEMSSLEKLYLCGCSSLRRLPELSGAPNLKELDLKECTALNYIHPSLAHHKRLVELNLSGCRSLKTLGDKLEMSSLEKLYLSWCSSLRRLPEFGECMKQLSILDLKGTGIEELPPTLGNLAGVSELYLTWCGKITGLLLSLGCFVGLKSLVLSSSVELSCLPQNTDGLESLTVRADYDDSDSSSREESNLSYDIAHLASLTDLNLSMSRYLRVPITIHQLPRLTRLNLSDCIQLEVLPELPSSLRELQARGCDSLDASNIHDVISKACCVFAESASQDREDLFQMLFNGVEMPAWFEDQEEDNGLSLSFPHNSPSTETVALALCFLLYGDKYSKEQPSVICNGKEFINTRLLKVSMSSYYKTLLILCLNGYSFSNLLCQDNRFQLQFPPSGYCNTRAKRSGARWVTKQDIQEFKKRKSQTGKRKATLELNMDIISHPSSSRNKMLVVDPPMYEEEEEHDCQA